MGRRRQKFFKGDIQHVYHRTIHRVIIFYSSFDLLVYLTLFSVKAKWFGVMVLGVHPMPDHLHSVVVPDNPRQLASFEISVISTFTRLFNAEIGRKGPLFEKRFGRSVKHGDKKKRTCLAYNYNNAVEKKLVPRCEDFRWNLLSYARTPNPYSEKIVRSKASARLLLALDEVTRHHADGEYLGYGILKRLFAGLSQKERNQLTDHILYTYSPIDYPALIAFYGSYRNMIGNFNSNTGDEYEIREDYSVEPDTAYSEISRALFKEGICHVKEVIVYPDEQKRALFERLRQTTRASARQIRKYLHYFEEKKDPFL